jgi:hypothetical protein
MSVGFFGTKTLSGVDYNDVDIFYAYSPSREEVGGIQFNPLYGNTTENDLKKMIGVDGVFKLRLPANIFNQLGIYTVVIKPKAFETQIIDCSFVVTNNNNEIIISKKGIVIPKLQFQGSGNLIGYQIEYFDQNGVKVKNLKRIVTSSELVTVSVNNNSTNPSSTYYTLNDSGNFLFLTLSPDESSLISDEQKINLGSSGQRIIISNTFFDPEVIEVEMVRNTIDSLAPYLKGNSTRNLKTSRYSIFDEEGNIVDEYNLYTKKSTFDNANIDIKERVQNIDFNKTFRDTSNGS